jgi:hypothetical protein
MKHKNTELKARLRAAAATTPATPATPQYENPEGVEILLAKRRQKLADEVIILPPPDRAGMIGELKLDGITTGWFDITPQLALHWLDYNKENRKLNKYKVQSFARQIVAGDFICTHQGVAFNDENELIDGQHSLKAIVMTGHAVKRMVTFGLPKKPAGKNFTTMDVIDAGGRSVADQLKISHGLHESSAIKQVCAALSSLCYGARTRNLSVGQTLQVYDAFKPSVDFMVQNRSKQHGLKQVGVLAGFAFADAAGVTLGSFVKVLFAALNTGDGLIDKPAFQKRQRAGDLNRPVEHLRYFLTGEESALFNKSMNRCISEITLQVIYAEVHKARTRELEQADVGKKWFAAKQRERVEKVAALFRLPAKD